MDFYHNLKRFGKRIALKDSEGNALSYNEIDNLTDMFSEKMGCRQLILQLCTNTLGSAAGYLAALGSRNVSMLLDCKMDKELLQELLKRYRPSFIYLPKRIAEAFRGESVLEVHDYVLLKTEEKAPSMDDQLALLLTTSGSTGSPKFVRLSYRNLNANAESIMQYLKIDSEERPITTLPMHYTYGLSIINSHILAGAEILMTEYTLFQKEFWNYLEREQATSFGGVPYTYEMLKKLHIERMPLPSVTVMTQAGGRLSVELQQEYLDYAEQNGKKFFIMYGQTEATARMSYLPPNKSREKIGSIGIAIPGGRFELIDANGEVIRNVNVTGELVYYGPNVSMGYAECREDLDQVDERKGYLRTGDMARRDEDGFYYLVGRKKRFLKLLGKRVNMDEVEQMVKSKFRIDAAVAGDDYQMRIYIAGEEDADIAARVQEYLSEKLGIYYSVFAVKHICEIPKNSSGKILYKEL